MFFIKKIINVFEKNFETRQRYGTHFKFFHAGLPIAQLNNRICDTNHKILFYL